MQKVLIFQLPILPLKRGLEGQEEATMYTTSAMGCNLFQVHAQ
jgi:hypothetical protein